MRKGDDGARRGAEVSRRIRRPPLRLAAVGLACALAGAGCAGPGAESAPEMLESEAMARSLMEAWEAGDTETVVDLFRPDAVYDDFANQVQYRGVDEIVGYVSHAHSWATALSVDVTAVHASEDGAVVEWLFSAVQDGPMGQLVPEATGREIVLNGVTVIEVEGGAITRAADYIDTTPLILQVGGRIELPGGVVWTLDGIRREGGEGG